MRLNKVLTLIVCTAFVFDPLLPGTAVAVKTVEPNCKVVLAKNKELKAAFQKLKKASTYSARQGANLAGVLPEEKKPLAEISGDACSEYLLVQLIDQASAAGKLWALEGLQQKHAQTFIKAHQRVLEKYGALKVLVWDGDVIEDNLVVAGALQKYFSR